MHKLPSRRALLAGAPVAAAGALLAGPAVNAAAVGTVPAAGADAELLDLCRRTIEQSECWAEADLIQDRLHAELGYKGPFRPELEDRASHATEQAELEFTRLSELYVAVINTSALTTEGVYAKAEVVFKACWGGEQLESLDNLMSITTDANIALSLVRDLINRGRA
jgi:hypothetical protein